MLIIGVSETKGSGSLDFAALGCSSRSQKRALAKTAKHWYSSVGKSQEGMGPAPMINASQCFDRSWL